MSKDDKYFQFPLVLLAMRAPWDVLCNSMCSCTQIKYMQENECSFADTQTALNIKGGWELSSKRFSSDVESFIASLPDMPARKATVRIKTDIIFDSRDDKGLDERHVRVLLAIYSAIGNNPMRRIVLDDIGRRALGCASQAFFNAMVAVKGKGYCRDLLTDKQLRRTVEDLHDGGHFARATYRNRLTYYSHRLTIEALWDLIEKQKMPMLVRRAQRELDLKRSESMAERAREKALLATQGQVKGSSGATQGQL